MREADRSNEDPHEDADLVRHRGGQIRSGAAFHGLVGEARGGERTEVLVLWI
jgi:hypothetical protein